MRRGAFAAEITPVTVKGRKGEIVRRHRTRSRRHRRPAKIPTLKPAFRKDGTVTAATSSSISDGARGARCCMSAAEAQRRGIEPLARIARLRQLRAGAGVVHHRPGGRHPEAARAGSAGRRATCDLYEVNEAFAVVTMAAMQDVGFDHAASMSMAAPCALGHPIGATGARILATLVHALRARGGGAASPRCASAAAKHGLAVEVPS